MHNTQEGVQAVPALGQRINDPRRDEKGMWKKVFTAGGASKHSRHCVGSFGRRDFGCYRCVELELGAAPRDGWQHGYFAKKLGGLQGRLF